MRIFEIIMLSLSIEAKSSCILPSSKFSEHRHSWKLPLPAESHHEELDSNSTVDLGHPIFL